MALQIGGDTFILIISGALKVMLQFLLEAILHFLRDLNGEGTGRILNHNQDEEAPLKLSLKLYDRMSQLFSNLGDL